MSNKNKPVIRGAIKGLDVIKENVIPLIEKMSDDEKKEMIRNAIKE